MNKSYFAEWRAEQPAETVATIQRGTLPAAFGLALALLIDAGCRLRRVTGEDAATCGRRLDRWLLPAGVAQVISLLNKAQVVPEDPSLSRSHHDWVRGASTTPATAAEERAFAAEMTVHDQRRYPSLRQPLEVLSAARDWFGRDSAERVLQLALQAEVDAGLGTDDVQTMLDVWARGSWDRDITFDPKWRPAGV
ncbi:hypothetical protein [Lichenicola sp.]|uniref:hypothetical protein n=1 Tax=Lichenicola sp. TaxID=2804529 RepID=UPI003B00B6A3